MTNHEEVSEDINFAPFPKVFRIAHTSLIEVGGLNDMLNAIGAEEWHTNATEDHAYLTEVAGRLCYKSFGVGLNPNITKVREGNHEYVGNILKQRHGSVLEHSSVTYALIGVSRILTHELVRHRTGVAISQESQRFVRLDDFQVFIPELTPVFEDLSKKIHGKVENAWVEHAELAFFEAADAVSNISKDVMNSLIKQLDLDSDKVPFHIKKQLTSALRRLVPGGVTTNIIVTANHRAWRHMIEMRTSAGAEAEIALVFRNIAKDLVMNYPAIYQDMQPVFNGDTTPVSFAFDNPKV